MGSRPSRSSMATSFMSDTATWPVTSCVMLGRVLSSQPVSLHMPRISFLSAAGAFVMA